MDVSESEQVIDWMVLEWEVQVEGRNLNGITSNKRFPVAPMSITYSN